MKKQLVYHARENLDGIELDFRFEQRVNPVITIVYEGPFEKFSTDLFKDLSGMFMKSIGIFNEENRKEDDIKLKEILEEGDKS